MASRAPAPGRLRVDRLEWTAGLIAALLGALLLVAPHRAVGAVESLAPPLCLLLGAWCLAAGYALIGVAALGAPRWLTVLVELLAAAALVSLAALTVAADRRITAVMLAALAGGLAAAAGQPAHCVARDGAGRPDLLAITVAEGAILLGGVLLALPQPPGPDWVTAVLRVALAVLLLGSGALLLAVQLHAGTARRLGQTAHLALAAVLVLALIVGPLRQGNWVGVLLLGSLAAVIAVLPWCSVWLPPRYSASLGARLALTLVVAASLPLTALAAMTAERYERAQVTAALERVAGAAVLGARGTDDLLNDYRSALAALAAQPLLASETPELREAALVAVAAIYREMVALGFRAPDEPLQGEGDLALFDAAPAVTALADSAAALPVLVARPLGDERPPLLLFTAGVAEPPEAALLAAVESPRLGTLPSQAGLPNDLSVMLLDEENEVVLARSGDLRRLDPRGVPTAPAASGARVDGDRLVGWARLTAVPWMVVVARPTAAAVAIAQLARELAFAVLLLAVVLAGLMGILIARLLGTPLAALAQAAGQMAVGESGAPLPHTDLTELHDLAAAFGAMRDRVAARTAERERARAALQFLAEASAQLAASLDQAGTAACAARLAVPELADYCAVDLLDEAGALQRVVVAGGDPAQQAALRQAVWSYPPANGGFSLLGRALATGEAALLPELTEERLATLLPDASARQHLQALDLSAVLVAPLMVRARPIGSLSLFLTRGGRGFGAAEQALAEELARRAAAAFDNAGLYAAQQFARAAAEQTAAHLARLQAVTEVLAGALTSTRVAEVALAHGQGAVDARGGLVVLRTENGGLALAARAGVGPWDTALAAWLAADEGGPLAAVLSSRAPVWLETPVVWAAQFPRLAAALGDDEWTVAVLPLPGEAGAVGVLALAVAGARPLRAEVRGLLLGLAQQCAQALERARLFEAERRALAAAEAAQQRAEAQRAELERFAYTVSHDLKAPLVSVRGFARRLERECGTALSERGQHYLARIQANVERQEQLIAGVLAWTRVGHADPTLQQIDLRAAIEQACDSLRVQVERSGARIAIDQPLPTVVASPTLLDQILRNLLDNALTYGARPGAAPDLAVGCLDMEHGWRLYVCDHGPGLPPEQAERAFALFERLPAGEAVNPRGTGLGLGVVRKAAETLGGSAGVEPTQGGGATFWVQWPRLRPTRGGGPTPPAGDSDVLDSALAARILLIENDMDHAQLAMLAFRDAQRDLEQPVVVEHVASGEAALERLAAALQGGEPPNLVLLDLDLPGLSGLEVLRALRADARLATLPVVVLTTSERAEEVRAARHLGVAAYLTKPLQAVRCRGLLASLAAMRGQPRAGGAPAKEQLADAMQGTG